MYEIEQVRKETSKYFKGDDLSTNVWISKYALKDKEENILELTPLDMHKRLAKEFARIESKYQNPLSEQEILYLLQGFKYIVPQGSPMFGIGNDFSITSLSNCFVIGSNDKADSYGSIMRTDEEQVQLMKRRGGVGQDISHLRPSGAIANNSVLKGMSGSTLYMERFSNSTREVSQGDRRGALMISIDVRHPDAEKFIDMKTVSGKVTGANVSVKFTDEFMDAVRKDEDFIQTFPVDMKIPIGEYYDNKVSNLKYDELTEIDCVYSNNEPVEVGYIKKIKARNLWNKVIHNAWKSAEPGVLFWDKVKNESPADSYGKDWESVSCNPCIIGSTLIAVADGRNAVSIEQLVKEKVDVPVYSTNPENGKINIKWGRNPRKTKEKTEVWKLTLDDNTTLIATPDHQIMLKDGSYCSLSKLKKNQSLKPFNTYLSEGSWNEGYRCINSKSDGYSRQYRMIYEFFNNTYNGKLFNIHHKDENRLNDLLENLELVNAKNHRSEHKLGKKNPYYTHENVRETLRKNAAHPGKTNPKYIDISNEEIIEEGRKCFNQNNRFSKNIWEDFVSKNEKRIPNVASKFRFGSFSKFKSCVIDNHKVKSVEFYGYEDVYNITVDDYHNYNIITSGDDKYIGSSGITIKNCGEIPLCPYDSCRLLAINLYSYVIEPFTKDAFFDFNLFKDHVNKAQRLMDDLVDLEIEKVDKIISKVESDPEPEEIKAVELNLWKKIRQKAIDGRRTGLGITAEGDMLAALGLKYGTKLATDFATDVHKVLAVESYKASIEMAKERGCFPIWSLGKEGDNPFITRVISEADLTVPSGGGNKGEFGVLSDYYDYGRRNIANLTIAPTGSVSILTQTTSGIEPVFQVSYKRRRKVEEKEKCNFIDEIGDMWEEYNVFHPKFVEWFATVNEQSFEGALAYLEILNREDLVAIIKQSPYYKATSSDVDYLEKVRMQGEIQRWIDHSISVTVNMPEDVTEEMVSQVYMKAYESGCKGVTVYREGSRSGVLISHKKEGKPQADTFTYNEEKKRPEVLKCDIFNLSRNKQAYTIVVGKLDEKPYEIFVLEKLSNIDFPDKIQTGEIIKTKSKTYKLRGEINDKTYTIPNIVNFMSNDEQKDTRKYSLMLRYGIKPKHIIEQIEEYASITSFDKVVAKVLSNYLNGEKLKHDLVCPNCQGSNLKNETGCITCQDCGWSKCG